MTQAPQPNPPAAPALSQAGPDKEQIIRGFEERIARGEFEKSFHRFVQKEIYPLLANGTLKVPDFERVTRAYSRRYDPYNRGLAAADDQQPPRK